MSSWVVLFDNTGLHSLVSVDQIKKEVFLAGTNTSLNGLVLRACIGDGNPELWYYSGEMPEDDMRNLWEDFPEEMKKAVREKGVNLKNKDLLSKMAEEIRDASQLVWLFDLKSKSWLNNTMNRLKT